MMMKKKVNRKQIQQTTQINRIQPDKSDHYGTKLNVNRKDRNLPHRYRLSGNNNAQQSESVQTKRKSTIERKIPRYKQKRN